MAYDSSLTVFSPEGHLIQVQYAHKAVQRGTATIGIKFDKGVILAVQRKQTARLQSPDTNIKLFDVDEGVAMTFSGLMADARQLIAHARLDCQSHRMTYDIPPQLEVLTIILANYMQEHTQSGGRRPFGVSILLAGQKQLFSIDPSGVHAEWQAVAIGGSAEKLQTYLEKNYKNDLTCEQAIKLAKDCLGTVIDDVEAGVDFKVIT